LSSSSREPGRFARSLDPLLSVADEDREAVRAEIGERNARHLRVLVPVTFPLHLIGLWTGLRGMGPDTSESTRRWLEVLASLHLTMFVPATLLLALLYVERSRGGAWRRARELAGEVFVFLYAIFGALVSANAQRARPNIDIFTLCLLAGAFLATPARASVPSALVGGAVLSAAIVHFGADEAHVRSMLANTISMTIGAIVFARVIYTSNVREIAARRLSERRGDELAAVNATLETKVAEKVGEVVAQAKELARLNTQLEARVEERSRELSEALEQLARARPSTLDPGRVLDDRVRIVRFLAEGGMGAVYEAVDTRSGEPVAVKLVKASFGDHPDELQRFLREARAGARVLHPGVARTLHVDLSSEGCLYQVQELVDGVPLGRALGAATLSPADAAALGAVLAHALAAAHAKGVVHRDVKPSNVMLSKEAPGLKVLDFGISKLAIEERETLLTASSHILGTPESMAPEQVLTPGEITDRCDVYLLGLLLYRLIAGRSPYTAESASQFLMAHAFEAPIPLSSVRADTGASLAAVVHACLEKSPSARPAMADVAAVLERERGESSALEVSRRLLALFAQDTSRTRPRVGPEAVTHDARGGPPG
jgi:hypothetical protein